MTDYTALMWAEVDDMGKLVQDLSDQELDVPSLCEGWRVRDVLGHMSMGHTYGWGQILRGLARNRFNLPKASYEGAIDFASERSAEELRRFWLDVMVGTHPSKGVATVIPKRDGFFDHLVHHQDIRRALGRPREIDAERLVTALDAVTHVSSPFFSTKKPTRGLTLRATDIDWSTGSGPEVAGPAESVIMAAAGRRVALDELTGDGVAQLRRQLGD